MILRGLFWFFGGENIWCNLDESLGGNSCPFGGEVSSMFEFDLTVLPRRAQTYAIKGKGVAIIFRAAKGSSKNKGIERTAAGLKVHSCCCFCSQLVQLDYKESLNNICISAQICCCYIVRMPRRTRSVKKANMVRFLFSPQLSA